MATRATKIWEHLSQHHQFEATEAAKKAEFLGKDHPDHEDYKNRGEHYTAMAEAALAECDAANKAAADEILKVSAIAPTVRPNVRAVPRYGQRGFEKTEVPAEFAKFVTRCDEEF